MFRPSDPDQMLNKTKTIPLISNLLRKRKSTELAKLGTESSAQYPSEAENLSKLHSAEKFSSSTQQLTCPILPG